MERVTRIGVALLATAALLFVASWLDGTVMRDAQRQQASTFDLTPLLWWYSLGYLVTAAGVLAAGLVGWWARSLAAGIAFLVSGAFFALLEVINWQLAASVNSAPPVLPEPLARAVSQIYFWQSGPIGSMRIVGAAVFLVGILITGSEIRRRVSGRVVG
jgi:hypothetical protein